jgi:hypothetical protein
MYQPRLMVLCRITEPFNSTICNATLQVKVKLCRVCTVKEYGWEELWLPLFLPPHTALALQARDFSAFAGYITTGLAQDITI